MENWVMLAGFLSAISAVIVAVLLFSFISSAYGITGNVISGNVGLIVYSAEGNWTSIEFPEGVYEPQASGLAGTHLFTFFIKFVNLSANINSSLGCYIQKSNGGIFFLNSTIQNTIIESNYTLNYTLSAGDNISKYTPWKILNCSLRSLVGNVIKSSSSDYASHNNKSILVHGNSWTKFSSATDDSYLAGLCFLGWPKAYFNNTMYCDYVGDVAFSVSMATGFAVEGYCRDNADNDGNAQTDCTDRYCRGIPYSCIQHAYAGDPFTGTCNNGVCTDSRTIGGHTVSYSYNRYVKPGETLKVRFDGGSYNSANPILYSITGLVANNYAGKYGSYTDSYALPSVGATATSITAQDTDGYTGDVDMVLWVNLSAQNYSEGIHNFSVYIVNDGADLLIAGNPIIVDSNAPSAWNEAETGSGRVTPCANDVDEDFDYAISCADSQCNGQIGGTNGYTGGPAYCQYPSETICNDLFDNNRNSAYDCGDSSCDLRQGHPTDTNVLCHILGEGKTDYDATIYPWTMACADIFNNDQEDGIDCVDTTFCRNRGGTSTTLACPAHENNSASWCFDSTDNDYDSAIDCNDIDCLGMTYTGYICSTNETININGNFDASRCFDNKDNDFDGAKDCADDDCEGVSYNGMTCNPFEFNFTKWIENSMVDNFIVNVSYCADTRDNDGNGYIDCNDLTCKQKFGVCGPCPTYENISWASCANGHDDNTDGAKDCADSECLGEMGSKTSGQLCAAGESGDLCSDGFDNDADGLTDCADAGCAGATGKYGQTCGAEGTNALCGDNLDNDGDGLTDCAETSCYGTSACAAKSWSTVSCVTVPYNESWNQIASTTISVQNTRRHYVNSPYVIKIRGSASNYPSVTVTLGNAVTPSLYFPYDATSCVLSGDTSKVKWVASQTTIGQLQDLGSAVTGGFEVSLTCMGAAGTQDKSYPVSVSNQVEDSTENGEESISATVYENTAPTISALEIEPYSSGNVNIEYGSGFFVRGIPSADSSGICQCIFTVDGTDYTSNGECTYNLGSQTNDRTITASAKAKDGASNLGGSGGTTSIAINVMPKQNSISLNRASNPFYNSSKSESVSFTSSFTTASSGNIASCLAWIEDASGNSIVSKSVAPSGSSISSCNDNFDVSSLTEGIYYLVVNATDEDGNTKMSDKKVFYNCPTYGDVYLKCARADFNNDGNPDSANCRFVPHYNIILNLTMNVTTYLNSTGENTTITIYPQGSTQYLNQTSTNESQISYDLSSGSYDIGIDTFNSSVKVTINNISFSADSVNYVNIDKVNTNRNTLAGYLGIYEISSDFTMNSALIVINYSNMSYVIENNLGLYQCSNWNRTLGDCGGSWNSVDSARTDSVGKLISTTVSLSTTTAFAVLERTPTTYVPSVGGAGGDSKAVPLLLKVEPSSLDVSMIAGKTEVRKLKVTNLAEIPMTFDVLTLGKDIEFVVYPPSRLALAPGETKEISVEIKAPQKGLLTGIIAIRTRNYEYDVPVVINVKSENFLFDASISVLERFRRVITGNAVKAQVDLVQMGSKEKVDVLATYVVKDYLGNVYLEESETFAVLVEKSYIRDLSTLGLAPGRYIVGLEIVYPGAFATSSSQFEVMSKQEGQNRISKFWWFLLFFILAFIILVTIRVTRRKNERKNKQKTGRRKV